MTNKPDAAVIDAAHDLLLRREAAGETSTLFGRHAETIRYYVKRHGMLSTLTATCLGEMSSGEWQVAVMRTPKSRKYFMATRTFDPAPMGFVRDDGRRSCTDRLIPMTRSEVARWLVDNAEILGLVDPVA